MDKINYAQLQSNIDDLKDLAYQTSLKYSEKLNTILKLFENKPPSQRQTIINSNKELFDEFEELSSQMDNVSRLTSAFYAFLAQPEEETMTEPTITQQPELNGEEE